MFGTAIQGSYLISRLCASEINPYNLPVVITEFSV
jgi:hypothetical protein